ncbi:MAG: class I SAM-dependent methyltransferase [Thermoplasmata archaeon]
MALAQRHVRKGLSDAESFYDQRRIAMTLAPILEIPHRVVVEVGSGYGAATRALSKAEGVRLAVGIEADPVLLRESGLPGYRPAYVLADAERVLPFRAGSVDSLLSSEVYEHMYQPEAFFREAHRVLRPGGRLVLTTPNTESLVLMFLRRLPREWARGILTRDNPNMRRFHPEFFGVVVTSGPHGHRIEGASVREMERLAPAYGFRQIRATTWGLPGSHAFWDRLPRGLRIFLMKYLHALGVGLRHILVIWERGSELPGELSASHHSPDEVPPIGERTP